MKQTVPMVIIVGGFAGTGKTTHTKRLSSDLSTPHLSSDVIGQIVSTSQFADVSTNAVAIAYDVVFGLCEEFLRCGVSSVLDLNMAWEFQWQHLDMLRTTFPAVLWIPIILRAPKSICLERIQRRHAAHPNTSASLEVYMTKQHILDGWNFLERLDRLDVTFIDASKSQDKVYEDIRSCIEHSRATYMKSG
jgi:predicted kinase